MALAFNSTKAQIQKTEPEYVVTVVIDGQPKDLKVVLKDYRGRIMIVFDGPQDFKIQRVDKAVDK